MQKVNKSGSGTVVAHVDGGSRGNPGPGACGAVLSRDGAVIARAAKFLGHTTNNRAEYGGLILALKRALELEDCHNIIVKTDSQLLARQVSGKYKIKDAELRRLHAAASELIANFKSFKILEIPREENKEADKLANKAMDMGIQGNQS
jgi:ribonuclease HI